MFGYIRPNLSVLSEENKSCFRTCYCGLCQALRREAGWNGSLALSYDLTFLAMLLSAVYDDDENTGKIRCPIHPVHIRMYAVGEAWDYAARMNLLLFHYKCDDNWHDDHNPASRLQMRLIKGAFERSAANHPAQAQAIRVWIEETRAYEADGNAGMDQVLNSTGAMLGRLFSGFRPDDYWADTLGRIGEGLGRFIHFMDAYEDLPRDLKRGQYNILKPWRNRADYEDACLYALQSFAAESADAFEALPIWGEKADILRNILYSGLWMRYAAIRQKRTGEYRKEEV